ncbi:CPBP family intramembrane glutamic endopeptidase [Nocardia sp. NPDC020380]|uniref:CPBP family intramembrane glutamic endopeptidase n=1 Tax=Nocardia sp. NPDC020380 TaxID=3364309 RepID=UPI0037A7548A
MSSRPVHAGNTQAGASESPTAVRVWAALAVYVLATLAASVVLLAVQPLSGIGPAVLSLVQFGPALGVLVTWLAFRNTVSRLLPAPVSSRRVGISVLVTVVVCALFLLLVTVAAVVSDTAMVGPVAVGGVPFVVFVVLQLIGACGEEIGWRGFMQPLLESRMARVAAILVTGTTWALWHVQAFVAGPVTGICFFASAVGSAIVLGYLSTGSFRQRVLIAAIGHWLINIACYLLAGDNTLDQPQLVFMAIGTVLVAAGVMMARSLLWRDRMGRTPDGGGDSVQDG